MSGRSKRGTGVEGRVLVEMPFTNSDEFFEDQIRAFGVKGQVGPNGGAGVA